MEEDAHPEDALEEVQGEGCLPQGGAELVSAPVTGSCPHRLAHVQTALRRRAADLRDSLVLSEFLQDLQEEEARSQQGPAAVSREIWHLSSVSGLSST